MAEIGIYIAIMIVGSALGFWLGYLLIRQVSGKEVAQATFRGLLPLIPILLLYNALMNWNEGLLMPVVTVLLVMGIAVYLLSWPARKREAGNLMLNAGITPTHKTMRHFFIASLFIGTAFAVSLFWDASDITFAVCGTIVFLANSLLLFRLGYRDTLEMREHGICNFHHVFLWQRIRNWKWAKNNPQMLMIWHKPRFPLIANFISIKVPASHRDNIHELMTSHATSYSLQERT